MKLKQDNIHLIGPNSDKDWDGVGTHPMWGEGACGDIGNLTDCISLINCKKCREIVRNDGEGVTKWMESEWLRHDQNRLNKFREEIKS